MSHGFILVALSFALATTAALSQAPNPPRTDAVSKELMWDVISVKPNHTLNSSGSISSLPDSLVVHNMTLMSLFITAFGLKSDDQVVGLPGWVSSEHFDIQAKMDPETANAWKRLKGEEQTGQWHSFFRQILENRFGLKYHIEKQERPVYNLVIAKHGPKLKEAASDESSTTSASFDRISAQHGSISSLVFSLSGAAVDRIVIDKTGLTGKYDFDLTWSPDNEQESGPSIFTAIQEQLGLKLEPARAPLDMVVIDHLERPAEN